MSDPAAASALRQSIQEDEEALARLKAEEDKILGDIERDRFPSANARAKLRTEMQVLEERLRKTRMRLATR